MPHIGGLENHKNLNPSIEITCVGSYFYERCFIFSEKLTAICYSKILETSLIPFIRSKFPCQHRFQQDNDLKHTFHYVQDFLKSRNIEWWKTPAESADLNPIEKIWGSMKSYLRGVHFRDPSNRNLAGLKTGIKKFWKTLTPAICSKYINHIHKVLR